MESRREKKEALIKAAMKQKITPEVVLKKLLLYYSLTNMEKVNKKIYYKERVTSLSQNYSLPLDHQSSG